MAGVDPIRLGLSGLVAAQRGLATSGQNIANVGTDGYSRQRVQQVASVSGINSGLSPGNGVTVTDVERIGNAFLDKQISRMAAEHGQASSQSELSSRLDRLLSDPDTGLIAPLARFTEALAGVARDPSSTPLRQSLLEQGGQLAARFKALDSEFSTLDEEVSQRLDDSVNRVNALTAQIADLNNDIAVANARGSSFNNLLDQRDQAVVDLSAQIGVTTLAREDGTLDVLTRGGESLVSGVSSRQLGVATDPLRPNRLVLTNTRGNISATPVSGGTLGGLQGWRQSVLDPARAQLGQQAVALSAGINAQHKLGQDLNGDFGGDFFVQPTVNVNSNPNNAGGTVTALITDIAGLVASDYVLVSEDGANKYTLTRQTDGKTFAIDTAGSSPFLINNIDGLQISINAGAVAGDAFLLQPTTGAASLLEMNLHETRKIAAAIPVLTELGATNTGNIELSALTLTSSNNLPLSGAPINGDLLLKYDSANSVFIRVPDPLSEGPISYDSVLDKDGKTVNLLDGSIQLTLQGSPANGDVLTLRANADGSGDSRNIHELEARVKDGLLDQGRLSLGDAWGTLVSGVAVQAQAGDANERSFSNLLSQAQSARESVSGVNLDEEAANLLRYQQAYRASAQVISASEELFNTLLRAVGG